LRIGLDTNIVLRNAVSTDPQSGLVQSALARLLSIGWQPVLIPQTLVEFWAVATRSSAHNGLGLPVSEARRVVDAARKAYPLLAYPETTVGTWLSTCVAQGVLGKQTHDAHLAVAYLEGGVDHLLTLNTSDFKRFPGLTCVTPYEVLSGALDHIIKGKVN
jgi:predicted nucleic acid-binding protein